MNKKMSEEILKENKKLKKRNDFLNKKNSKLKADSKRMYIDLRADIDNTLEVNFKLENKCHKWYEENKKVLDDERSKMSNEINESNKYIAHICKKNYELELKIKTLKGE